MEKRETPPFTKRRLDPPPDIPFGVSSLGRVQALILHHNSQKKAKHRLPMREFLSHSFITLGDDVIKEKESKKQTQLVGVLVAFTEELAEKHHFMPPNTAASKVIHSFCEANLIKEGIQLVQCLLSLKEKVSPLVFGKCFEERTVTVSLRLCAKYNDAPPQRKEMQVLEEQLLGVLPAEKFKRRLFSPLFERAMIEADVQRALQILEMAVLRSVELWDNDYHLLLETIEKCVSLSKVSPTEAAEYAERILTVMEDHHPVVGAENARIFSRLLGGSETAVSSLGECKRCHEQLSSFQLSDDQREELLNDVVHKLIQPKIEGAHEKEKPSEEEIKERWRCFKSFQDKLSTTNYDTVIDGANVGYYGLNSWYKDAKKAQLVENNVDLSTVRMSELEQIPIPVDVPPKFPIIDDMRNAAFLQCKRNPLIVLHQRHLDRAFMSNGENRKILSKWISENSVLSSPPFLNDDFCWLYAALKQPRTCIISNDLMRDHHFTILSPRFFIRWRQRHRITFRAMFHRATEQVVLTLKTPRPYSVWVQRVYTTPCSSTAETGCKERDLPRGSSLSLSSSSKEVQTRPTLSHWHIPFINSIAVLDQASNRVGNSEADVDLLKDGDDECSSWICTKS